MSHQGRLVAIVLATACGVVAFGCSSSSGSQPQDTYCISDPIDNCSCQRQPQPTPQSGYTLVSQCPIDSSPPNVTVGCIQTTDAVDDPIPVCRCELFSCKVTTYGCFCSNVETADDIGSTTCAAGTGAGTTCCSNAVGCTCSAEPCSNGDTQVDTCTADIAKQAILTVDARQTTIVDTCGAGKVPSTGGGGGGGGGHCTASGGSCSSSTDCCGGSVCNDDESSSFYHECE